MIIPVAVLGAVIGSFLNVVIFRLPRGLSIREPKWSFCPHCQHVIRWHDNVPLLGWLMLRARCRDCSSPISMAYPIVECLTSLLFVVIYDAIFVSHVASGINVPQASIATTWPLLIAWLTLAACLLATAAMDIEEYMIDIRPLLFAVVVGVVGHAIQGHSTLPGSAGVGGGMGPDLEEAPRTLPPALCLAAAAAGGAWVLTAVVASLFRRRGCSAEGDEGGAGPAEQADTSGAAEVAGDGATANESAQTAARAPHPLLQKTLVIILGGLVAAMAAWQVVAPESQFGWPISPAQERGALTVAVLLFALILASLIERPADGEIIEEIEAERHTARQQSLWEFATFIPALVAAVAVLVVLRRTNLATAEWPTFFSGPARIGRLEPHVAGLFWSLGAVVLACGLGWGVRILGTLAFGREAFGSGDIYIMAAIAAVGGFWLLVFGFFLAALLALVGVVATRFKKKSRAIPFGPWLALGSLAAVYLVDSLLKTFAPIGGLAWSFVTGRPYWE